MTRPGIEPRASQLRGELSTTETEPLLLFNAFRCLHSIRGIYCSLTDVEENFDFVRIDWTELSDYQ